MTYKLQQGNVSYNLQNHYGLVMTKWTVSSNVVYSKILSLYFTLSQLNAYSEVPMYMLIADKIFYMSQTVLNMQLSAALIFRKSKNPNFKFKDTSYANSQIGNL